MSRIKFYDSTRNYKKYKPEFDTAITKIAESGLFFEHPCIKELERQLTDYVGSQCILVNSPLYIALLALGIGGPDDEVITAAFGSIDAVEVILRVGAKVILVDIDKDTYGIDPVSKITPKTRAVIMTDLFGALAIAKTCNIPVIHDFSHSFGSTTPHGVISCVSFTTSPLDAWGNIGACFTKDQTLANKIRAIAHHGSSIRNFHEYIGTDGRVDAIQAAVLLVKLKYFDEQKAKRLEITELYTKKMAASVIKLPSLNRLLYVYPIRVKNREKLLEYFNERGIELNVFYKKPLSHQPILIRCGFRPGEFPMAEKISNELLCLPCYPELEEWETRSIIHGLLNLTG